MLVSVVIPCLNEGSANTGEEGIAACLEALKASFKNSQATYPENDVEIIVIDGGSQDDTLDIAKTYTQNVYEGITGRALQMNLGAKHAKGELILFLHADTHLGRDAFSEIFKSCTQVNIKNLWGRFDVRLRGRAPAFKIISGMINWRSRLSGIATGDQCIFISRHLFDQVGTYANIPLMEDVAISKRLKTLQEPLCLREKVTTSSRRWQQQGIVKVIVLMWYLRFAYFVGVDPQILHAWYYGKSVDKNSDVKGK